jgi:hypothetical protein
MQDLHGSSFNCTTAVGYTWNSVDLFPAPKKLKRSKMFGLYLHALTAHSPTQYKLVSLCSLNTENQERFFGQARAIADACTNHHAETSSHKL